MAAETDKKIDYRFRFLYAAAMILVVAYHCNTGGIQVFYDWFTPGPIGLVVFMFCSGYFYNKAYENQKGRYILKKLRTILLPVYLWNFFFALVTAILHASGFTFGEPVNLYTIFIAPLTSGHQYLFNLGLWYMVPLFCVEVLHVYISGLIHRAFPRAGEKTTVILFIFYMFLGFVGTMLAVRGYKTGISLFINRILYFLPFYGFGILYRRVLEKWDRLNSVAYFGILFAISTLLTYRYRQLLFFLPGGFDNFDKSPVTVYLVGFTGLLFWIRGSRFMEPTVRKSRLVNLLAENTYDIIALHLFCFFLVNLVYLGIHSWTGLASDFDVSAFRENFRYFYTPGGISQTLVLYLFAGVFLPLIWSRGKNMLRGKFKSLRG